jgi:general secretion pathway protein D
MNPRLIIAAAAAFGAAQFAMAQSQPVSNGRHVLKLDDAELNALIEDVASITGYTFIVHPDVRRTRVTVISQSPMTTAELFQVFLTTLRVHGFTALPAGRDTYRILPEQIAASEAPVGSRGTDPFVTEIFRLNTVNALEAAQMLRPLVDSQGQVVANANTNTLVVVDYASNIRKVREILTQMDRDRMDAQTVSLRNVPAAEMEQVLIRLHGADGEGGQRSPLSIAASATSNTIVIRGEPGAVARAAEIAARLDLSEPPRDNLRVVTLKNADAAELVPILERVGASMAAQRSPMEGVQNVDTIAHHHPTNSLIISANSETLMAMDRVIAALDVRRPQVMVEAIIVEMSDDAARELGLQFILSGTGRNEVPFASTNFSRAAPNLLALTGAIVTGGLADLSRDNLFRDAALNSLLGTSGLTAGIGGQSGDTLFGAILNAVEADTNSRILSTPFGMTLNNATSALIVGQEIPITTGQVLGDANTNPFRTVQRQDVGVQLEVTPRIGEDNTVQLDIRQEVSSVFGSIGTVTPDLILDKREIRTSVLADDGEIIVLGGLIEQRDTVRETKVPLLGDIPIAGRLFKSEGQARTRTNLMVFIRPTIIRTKDDAQATTAQKYLYVRAEELMRGVSDEKSIDAFIEQVLGRSGPAVLMAPPGR